VVALKTGKKIFLGIFFSPIIDDFRINLIAFTLNTFEKAVDFHLLSLLFIFIVSAAAFHREPSHPLPLLLETLTREYSGVHGGHLHGRDRPVDEAGPQLRIFGVPQV
jgi:hypothetical protein